jgi:hypothetical protein
MRKILLLSLILYIVCGCKNSVPDYSGNDKISAADFLKAFHELKLPVTIADTAIQHFADTLIISNAVFTQFIPDSTLNTISGTAKEDNIIHPAGMIHTKERDFLLATFSSNKRINLAVFALDDKHNFLTATIILNNTRNDKYRHTVTITEEPTFILKKEKLAPDNTSLYSRNGFAYNATTNSFTEVLHDSNEDTAKNNEIINPIDTLPSINKFSGDYITDKKNFISVRDGKNATSYMFFIHFEKSKDDCKGELKGTMTLTDEKNAVFTENGDPCVINFKFSNNSINVKEQDNCGNHRGITCPFNFTFKKKVQPQKKVK